MSFQIKRLLIKADIADSHIISQGLTKYRPLAIINFAVKNHVDRSILDPDGFIQTNIVGAYRLFKAALAYWSNCPADEREPFRFLQVSTDEVFGSLGEADPPFCEATAYAANRRTLLQTPDRICAGPPRA